MSSLLTQTQHSALQTSIVEYATALGWKDVVEAIQNHIDSGENNVLKNKTYTYASHDTDWRQHR